MGDDEDKIFRSEKGLCMKVADRFPYSRADDLSPVVIDVVKFDKIRDVRIPASKPFPGQGDLNDLEKDSYRYALSMMGADGVECTGEPVSREAIAAIVPEIVTELTSRRSYKTVRVEIPDYLLKKD